MTSQSKKLSESKKKTYKKSVLRGYFQFSHDKIYSRTSNAYEILLFNQYLEALKKFNEAYDVILLPPRPLCPHFYGYTVTCSLHVGTRGLRKYNEGVALVYVGWLQNSSGAIYIYIYILYIYQHSDKIILTKSQWLERVASSFDQKSSVTEFHKVHVGLKMQSYINMSYL